MAVRIRMKMMGRKHRRFFRICAVDARKPRDGRVLEELGTYDPMLSETDARASLKSERIAYWLGVGAQPSQKVKTLLKKYGADGTHVELQHAAVCDQRRVPERPIGLDRHVVRLGVGREAEVGQPDRLDDLAGIHVDDRERRAALAGDVQEFGFRGRGFGRRA